MPIFRVKSVKNYIGQKIYTDAVSGVRDKYQVWVLLMMMNEFSVGETLPWKGSASDFVINMRFVHKYDRSFPNSIFTQKPRNMRIATLEICKKCVNALKCYQTNENHLFSRAFHAQIYKAREFLHGTHSRQISIIVSLIIPDKYLNIVCPVVLVLSSRIIGG